MGGEGVEDEFMEVGEYFLNTDRFSGAQMVLAQSRTSAMSIVSWVTVRSSPSSDDVLTVGRSPRACFEVDEWGVWYGDKLPHLACHGINSHLEERLAHMRSEPVLEECLVTEQVSDQCSSLLPPILQLTSQTCYP